MHHWLQWTSLQRRYFEKKQRFTFEVPRTAAETDTVSFGLLVIQRRWCLFQQLSVALQR